MNHYIFFMSDECQDKTILGSKGANLVIMTKLGLPIPPGFIVSIEAFRVHQETGQLPEEEIEQAIAMLEKQTGKKLGENLKVSVRSSAPVSMTAKSTCSVRKSARERPATSLRRRRQTISANAEPCAALLQGTGATKTHVLLASAGHLIVVTSSPDMAASCGPHVPQSC